MADENNFSPDPITFTPPEASQQPRANIFSGGRVVIDPEDSIADATLRMVKDQDSDVIGEASRIGRRLGVDPGTVAANMIQARRALQHPDVKILPRRLRAAYADPAFAAMAKDDSEALAKAENAMGNPRTINAKLKALENGPLQPGFSAFGAVQGALGALGSGPVAAVGGAILGGVADAPGGTAKLVGSARAGFEGLAGSVGSTLQWHQDLVRESRAYLNNFQPQLGDFLIGANPFFATSVLLNDVAPDLGETASSYWKKEARAHDPFPADVYGTFVENPSFLRASSIVFQALPSLMVAVGATVATGGGTVAGPAALSLLEAGSTYEDAKEKGKAFVDASVPAVVVGLSTFFLERIGLEAVLRGSGGVLRRTLGGALGEAGTEVSQTVVQNAVARGSLGPIDTSMLTPGLPGVDLIGAFLERYGYDKTRGLWDGVVEAFIGGFGAGGAVSVGTAAIDVFQDDTVSQKDQDDMVDIVSQVMADFVQKQTGTEDASKQAKQVINDVVAAADESKLKQRDPETLRQYLTDVAASKGTPRIFVDAKKVVDTLGENEQVVEDWMAEYDVTDQELNEALATGGKVALETGSVAVNLNDDATLKQLADDMSLDASVPSINESPESIKDAQASTDRINELAAKDNQRDEAVVAIDAIADQVVEISARAKGPKAKGLSKNQARKAATILVSMANTLAKNDLAAGIDNSLEKALAGFGITFKAGDVFSEQALQQAGETREDADAVGSLGDIFKRFDEDGELTDEDLVEEVLSFVDVSLTGRESLDFSEIENLAKEAKKGRQEDAEEFGGRADDLFREPFDKMVAAVESVLAGADTLKQFDPLAQFRGRQRALAPEVVEARRSELGNENLFSVSVNDKAQLSEIGIPVSEANKDSLIDYDAKVADQPILKKILDEFEASEQAIAVERRAFDRANWTGKDLVRNIEKAVRQQNWNPLGKDGEALLERSVTGPLSAPKSPYVFKYLQARGVKGAAFKRAVQVGGEIVNQRESVQFAPEAGQTAPAIERTTLRQEGGVVRAEITRATNNAIISLMTGHNVSSIPHELAHGFMEHVRVLGSDPNANASVKKLWADIKKEYKFKSDKDFIPVEAQELFARGFEKYLSEGKAPSLGLADVFESFRRWMSDLYLLATTGKIPGLKAGDISNEARSIFDRMLATDQEIEEARQEQGMIAMFDEVFLRESGATQKEIEEYAEAVGAVINTANRKLNRKKLAGHARRLADWKRQAENEAKELPLYKTLAALNTKNKGRGLDRDSFIEEYGKDALKRMPNIPGLWKEGGMPFGRAAIENGYESSDAMFKDFESYISKAQWVEQRVAEVEIEHDNSLKGDELVQVKLARQLEIETQWIRKRGAVKAKALARKAIREWADNQVDQMTPQQAVNISGTVATMRSLRNKAINAQRNGQWKKAFDLNERVRLNEELINAKSRAKDKIAKMSLKFGKALNADMENRWRNQVVSVVNRYGLVNRPIEVKEADLKSTPTLQEFFRKLRVEAAESDAVDVTGIPTFLDEVVLENGRQGNWKKNLTFAEAKEVADMIDYLVGQGREAKQNLLTDGRTRVQDAAELQIQPLKGQKRKRRLTPEVSVIDRAIHKVRGIFGGLDSLRFFDIAMDAHADLTDSGRPTPNAHAQSNRLAKQTDAYNNLIEEVGLELGPAFLRLRRSGKGKDKVFTHVPIPEAFNANGLNRVWTWEKIVAVALNMGNQDNLNRLMAGYEMDRASLDKLTSVLSEQDWKDVQTVGQSIGKLFKEVDRVHFTLNNFHLKEVKATPFTAPTGQELDGWYYPAKYDGQLSDRAASWGEKEDLLNSKEAIFQVPSAKSSMTKERKGATGASLPLKLSMNVLSEHLNDTAKYIAYAEAVRDIDRVTRHPIYKKTVIDNLGEAAYRAIRPNLKGVINPDVQSRTDFDKIVEVSKRKSTAFILGLNTSVALKQLGSIPAVFSGGKLSFADYARGIKMVASDPVALRSLMREKSAFMRNRSNSVDRDLQTQIKSLDFNKLELKIAGKDLTFDEIQDMMFVMIRGMDFTAVFPVWWAAYDKALRAGKPDAEAVLTADNLVRDTQPSSTAIDLSAIQRSKNGFAQSFTMFSSFTMGKWGARQRAWFRAWRHGDVTRVQYIEHVFMEAILPPMMISVGFALLTGSEDDPEEIAKGALMDILAYQFAGIPVLRDVASASLGEFNRSPGESAAFTGFKILGSSGKAFVDVFRKRDAESLRDAVWEMSQIVAFATGVPFTQVYKRLVKGAQQISDGDGTPLNLLFPDPKRRIK